jgi:GntR family transcriptional regulator
MKINRDSSVALYIQIADGLARDIGRMRFKPFDRLPSESELMERYGVSRVTVRQSIARLVHQGLAISKQGKGAFVAGPVVQHELEELKGFYDSLVGQGHAPQTRLVEFGPGHTPPAIAQLLGTAGEQAVYLKRIYSLQRRPFALARAWLPPRARGISRDQASRNPLYAILQILLGLKVARAEVGIIARSADPEEVELLKLQPGSPVLVMERTSYASTGEALEISRFSIVPENYRFRLTVEGPLAITRQIQEVAAAKRSHASPAHSSKRKRNTQEKHHATHG